MARPRWWLALTYARDRAPAPNMPADNADEPAASSDATDSDPAHASTQATPTPLGTPPPSARRRRDEGRFTRWSALQIAAVIATGLVNLFLTPPIPQAWFIGVALVFWIGFLVIYRLTYPPAFREMGLTRANLRSAFLVTSAVGVAGIGALAIIGDLLGYLRLHEHMLPLLGIYPLWGVIQHALVQGLVARNLVRLPGVIGHPVPVTIVTACLFGLTHAEEPEIAAATFLLGLVFTPIYLRWRNVWPLGVWHGWLGAVAYFWLMNIDPWQTTILDAL